MALDFPSSPSTNDTYSFNGKSWIYNGSYWKQLSSLPIATNTALGGVLVDASTTSINIDANGLINTDLTLTSLSTGFSVAGGTTSKTLTVSNTLTLSGTDSSTLNIGSGGTLGSAAFTASTAYISSTLMTTLGDVIYGGASGTSTRLAAPTTNGTYVLTSVPVASAAVAPTWSLASGLTVSSASTATTATKSTNLVGGNNTTLLGAIPYQSNTDTTTLLSPNTTATKNFLSQTGTGTNGAAPSWSAVSKSDVGLANVENTALSTWAGSTNITTLGTIATGTWNATAIADGKIASALTGKTYNGLSLTAAATGFTIAGGTTSKTLTVSNTLTFSGTDGSTLNIGAGGTLGSNAYTSTSYQPLDADLTSIAGLAGTSGILKKTAADTWALITDNSTNWDTAFTDRNKWDGGSTGLTASTGRTSLGATTVGSNLFTLTNPSAITFLKLNADNTVTTESASAHRTSIGATTVGSNFFTLTNPSAITFPKINADNTVTAESASTHRTSLGLAIGTDVQAYSATLAGINTLGSGTGFLKNTAGTWSYDNSTYLTTSSASSTYEPIITAGTTAQYWRGDKSWQTLNSTAVGLGNVTNESKATMFTSPTFTGTVTTPLTTAGVVKTSALGVLSSVATLANSDLTNSSVTVNGSSISLGGSATVTANTSNSIVLKADSGTTEGTDLYTFNGSAGKTLNIVAGSNITITKTAGQWSIASSGGGGGGGTTTNSLVIKGDSGTTEGTNLYTFDGSTAKTLNMVSGTGVTIAETAGTFTFNNSGVTSVNGSSGAISNVLTSTASGVQTFLTTPSSANLISMVTDETGTGNLMFSINPTLNKVDSVNEGGQINFEPSNSGAGGTTWYLDSFWDGTQTQLRVLNVTGGEVANFKPNGTFTMVNGSFIPLTGNTSEAPIDFTSSASVVASPTGGELEFDGTSLTLVPNTSVGRVPIATKLFTSGTGTSGITGSTNYALFPAAQDTVTLPIGTYLVEASWQATVATSTVSGTMALNIRGAGTAVGTMTWNGTASITQGGAANEYQVAATNLGTNIVVTAASAVAGRVYVVRGSGILKVTTAGTIIPSYQWSATLTSGVVTLPAGNYMIITPLSGSGTAEKTGNWA